MSTILIAQKVESSEGDCSGKYEQSHGGSDVRKKNIGENSKFSNCFHSIFLHAANILYKDGKDNLADSNF